MQTTRVGQPTVELRLAVTPERASAAPRRSIALRLLIAALSLVAGIGLAEVGFRVRAALENSQAIDRALAEVAPPSDDPQAGLANVIRLSTNERIVYELQPSLVDRTLRGTTVSTDERGFRVCPSTPAAWPSEPITIVGLGDSIMFGDGVEDEDTFLNVLQALLAERFPASSWRVLNTGVPGYNTVMEVETLRTKALDLRPRLVILNVVSNDFAPPKFARNVEDPFRLDKSFLFEFVEERVGRTSLVEGDATQPWGALRAGKREGGEELEDPREHWRQFSRPAGIAAFRAAMAELAELARTHRFDVLVFSTYDHENIRIMMEEAAKHGFPCVNMMDELDAWLRNETGAGFSEEAYRASPLVVSPANSHPSALQHRMAAQRLLRELTDRGLIERSAGRE